MEEWQRLIDARLERIENLLEVVVRIEERQVNQLFRLEELEKCVYKNRDQIAVIDAKVDRWIQRGVGLWVGVSTLVVISWTLFTYIKR